MSCTPCLGSSENTQWPGRISLGPGAEGGSLPPVSGEWDGVGHHGLGNMFLPGRKEMEVGLWCCKWKPLHDSGLFKKVSVLPYLGTGTVPEIHVTSMLGWWLQEGRVYFPVCVLTLLGSLARACSFDWNMKKEKWQQQSHSLELEFILEGELFLPLKFRYCELREGIIYPP